jgi:hypothetical protein
LFSAGWIVYAAAIFVCGAICTTLRLRGAYRFAAITVSIVLLIAHNRPAWIVAWHRCIEVWLGIAVGLAALCCGQQEQHRRRWRPNFESGKDGTR